MSARSEATLRVMCSGAARRCQGSDLERCRADIIFSAEPQARLHTASCPVVSDPVPPSLGQDPSSPTLPNAALGAGLNAIAALGHRPVRNGR
eukprot:2651907-Pyramimonas_sp.AAC.1